MTAIISLKTNTASRSARGHLAMPSCLNANYLDTGGVIDSEWLDPLNAFAAKLDDDYDLVTDPGIGVTSLVPVVYSRVRHNASLEPYSFQIETAIVRTRVSWLRSRTTAP